MQIYWGRMPFPSPTNVQDINWYLSFLQLPTDSWGKGCHSLLLCICSQMPVPVSHYLDTAVYFPCSMCTFVWHFLIVWLGLTLVVDKLSCWWDSVAVEPVVMRGSAQQYPMMPSAQPHGFPVVVRAGTVPVPHQPMMQIGLPSNMHPHYVFQPSMYRIPVVRCCIL